MGERFTSALIGYTNPKVNENAGSSGAMVARWISAPEVAVSNTVSIGFLFGMQLFFPKPFFILNMVIVTLGLSTKNLTCTFYAGMLRVEIFYVQHEPCTAVFSDILGGIQVR